MATPRGSCLFVVSGAAEGVSAQSFLQAHTLISQSFTIQLASPNGRPIEYVQQDDSNRRWFNEFRSKAASTPIGLETVDVNRYSALLIPSCPGAVHDLTNNTDLGQIISHFVAKQKPICAIGMGTAGLFSARQDDGKTWHLEDYSMTAPSVFELANLPEFPTLPVVHEDFIKDNNGKYTCSVNNAVHVVIDRHLITGQNETSTLTAVQNLILMCTQKQQQQHHHQQQRASSSSSNKYFQH